jgi:allophanate hydrolase
MSIWIDRVPDAAVRAARADVARRVARGDALPLAGRTLAVKGNIDVAGFDTTAGCPAYAYRPGRSAAAVRALTDAGAVVVGITNLDQFATGLVGTRSAYGICPNAHWDELISGGSSSGSAVAVARGLADLALGTDTAGLGRGPAAANGIVGIKPTRGRISTAGVVPACASLDCVSVFARSVDMAAAAVDIAAGPDPEDPWSRDAPQPGPVPVPAGPRRLGIPDPGALDFDGDGAGADRFSAAASSVAGTDPTVPVDLEPFLAAGRLLYEGAFVAERYAAVGAFVDAHPDDVDPVVGGIISAAGRLPASRLASDLTTLERHRAAARRTFATIDVLVVPSVPRIPTVAQVQADPIGVNTMLGTYTNFVNLLDLCALTLPVPTALDRPDGPPTSVTLIAPAWHDDLLVDLARRVEVSHRAGTPASLPSR